MDDINFLNLSRRLLSFEGFRFLPNNFERRAKP
jgi:hypothetical protein